MEIDIARIAWAVGAFILVLTPIILVHELGHFLSALYFNIRVEEFGLGFPPRAAKLFTRWGTLFTINWIPLGGFVRPAGEDDPSVPGGLAGAPKLARFVVLAAGATANFILAAIVFWAALIYGPQAMMVGAVAPGSPAEAGGLQSRDLILRVDGDFADNANSVRETLEDKAGQPVAVLVLRDGEELLLDITPRRENEYDPAVEGPTGILLGFQFGLDVAAVADGSAGAAAGLLPGDRILSVNEAYVDSVSSLEDVLRDNAGAPIPVTVQRTVTWDAAPVAPLLAPIGDFLDRTPAAEVTLNRRVTLTLDAPAAAELDGVAFAFPQEIVRLSRSPLPAVGDAVESIWEIIALTVRAPADLIAGRLSPQQARPLSPIAISDITGITAESTVTTGDWFPLLYLVAVINVALGFTNLLPLPALDGGRLLFVLIEAVRGRRIEPERESFVHMVGMLFLLGLMAVLMFQDIFNPLDFLAN